MVWPIRLLLFCAVFLTIAGQGSAESTRRDAPSLYGIHWYGAPGPDNTALAGATDAEEMAAGQPLWVMEVNLLDTVSPDSNPGASGVQANPWDRPEYYHAGEDGGHAARVTAPEKGHSLIMRIQPNWRRNVPYHAGEGHPENDPFTLEDYAAAAEKTARLYKRTCRIWQVGNEVNLTDEENRRWNRRTGRYTIAWNPTPEQYAKTYLAVRDAIHRVTPEFETPRQIVLVQPVSPGAAGDPPGRHMDGVEFLWRTLEAIPENQRGKVDGFALHAYAEPGGENDGLDGFMLHLREQLSVIDQMGYADRPVFVTEFNKHMPDEENAATGARFVQRAYQAMHDWNNGHSGLWPGQPNHQIVSAIWFVYTSADEMWSDYSLLGWKDRIASTDPDRNPWYGFRAAAARGYPAGSMKGLGATIDHTAMWWADSFDTVSTTPPAPSWWIRRSGEGRIVSAENRGIRLLGFGNDGGVSLRSRGWAYGNFRLEVEFTLVDSSMPAGSINESEANFDIRIREGSTGYSLTFFADTSEPRRANRVILRRTNKWELFGTHSREIGIAPGDRFHVTVIARPEHVQFLVYRNADSEPAIDWTVSEDFVRTGWINLISYNIAEVQVHRAALGGMNWDGAEHGPWQNPFAR